MTDWTLQVLRGDLADHGLRTAVALSLGLDRRAADDDVLPDPDSTDRRGWVGDAWPLVESDQMGSRLWLLARSKELPTVLQEAERYAREALAWLLDARHGPSAATAVEVHASRPAPGVLHIEVTVTLRDGGRFHDLFEVV